MRSRVLYPNPCFRQPEMALEPKTAPVGGQWGSEGRLLQPTGVHFQRVNNYQAQPLCGGGDTVPDKPVAVQGWRLGGEQGA